MIKNTAKFERAEIAAYFGDSSAQFLPDGWSGKGVVIDSREVEAGNIFVALKGEKTDGHNYIWQAFDKGASTCIISIDYFKNYEDTLRDKPVIVVKNTLKALAKLAKIHRHRFELPIIVIGGSNGKTTTKDMTAAVLSQKFNVLSTYKNFNNQIGVPLMLLQLNDNYEVAVLEIGTNEMGEIPALMEMIVPTHGLITNIGEEHLEKLIDLDGVEQEETFIFGYLHKTNGVSIINMDDLRLKKYVHVLEEPVTYGSDDSNEIMIKYKIDFNDNLNPIISFSAAERKFDVVMKTYGYTSGLNAASAATIGFHFGLSDEEIKRGLESFELDSNSGYGRMLVEKINDFTVINDCYNANPPSMKNALISLSKFPGGKKTAVLADMRELGENTGKYHREILELAIESADNVYLFGEIFPKIADNVNHPKISVFEDKFELTEQLILIIDTNDVVLVKGSRGLEMEVVINELKKLKR